MMSYAALGHASRLNTHAMPAASLPTSASGSAATSNGTSAGGVTANKITLPITSLASSRMTSGLLGTMKSGASLSSSSSGASSAAAAAGPKRAALTFTLRLVVHPKSFSGEEMILNPKSVPGLRVGDIVEIFQPESHVCVGATSQQQQHQHRTTSTAQNTLAAAIKKNAQAEVNTIDPNNALFIKVQSLDPVKGQTQKCITSNFDVSLSSGLADLFHLQARKDVVLRIVSDHQASALEFIEISFKNQYIGRSDSWRIKNALQQSSVFSGQSIQAEGMKLRVDEILLGGRPAKSGLITQATRFTFRSRSARLFFLIQLSEEQWDFADDGELYFEKVLGFLKILFTEWQKLKVTHAVSIIFFSRTYLEVDEEWMQRQRHPDRAGSVHDTHTDEEEEQGEDDETRHEGSDHDTEFHPSATASHPGASPTTAPPVQTDPNTGRLFQDHYMVVIDCEVHDARNWENLIKLLKKKFNRYHLQLKWGTTNPLTGLRGFPSTAAEGNFLEAINCAVSVYEKHYLDRDMFRTGQNIVLFSAGIGMFVVDAKLARLTKQRMVDGGIGCDLICMTRPPLHSVPLFSFKGGVAATGGNVGFTTHIKEASKLTRAQTVPTFNHARRGSAPHIHTAVHHHSIQEGSEAEEANADDAHEQNTSPQSTNTHASQETQGTPNSSSTQPNRTPDEATTSPLTLPASSELQASRVPSQSPPSSSPPVTTHSLPPPAALNLSASPESTIRIISASSEKDLTKLVMQDKATEGTQPQYSVPHWLSIYFYDYQDLYDTPFGSLKTSHRDDISRNRNEEFVSLSSCRLFDFFDLSFFNMGQQNKPSLIPYFPAKEIAPPLQASLFDAYDASVFNPATQPIGLIGQEPWRVTTPHPAATPVTPTASSKVPEFPTPAVGATSAATVSFASPLPTSSAPLKSSPSQLHLPSPAAGSGAEATKKKTLGAKKKSSSGDVAGATDAAATPATPQSTTSGPNVALQQHVQNQGVKAPTTAFQTRWGHLFGHLYATLDQIHNPLRPNWKSLCQPGVLPLTTEYWPAMSELRMNYFEYNHTLVLVHGQNDYNNSTSALLEEVICQRQAQGYQHIVSDEIPKSPAHLRVYYFSLRNQVHQITLTPNPNSTIEVRRYIHKRMLHGPPLVKFPYSYFLWSPHTSSFLPMQRDIEPNHDDFKWSEADNLLCDRYSAELTEDMQYRRVHYAIIPVGIPAGKYASEYALHSSSKRFAGYADSIRSKYQEEWTRESDKRIHAFRQFFTFMFVERGDKIVAAATVAASATLKDATTTDGVVDAAAKEKADKAAAAHQALTQAFASFGIDVDRTLDLLPFPLPAAATEEDRSAQLAHQTDSERERHQADVAAYLDKYEHALGFAIADVPTREIKIPLTKPAAPGEPAKRYEWFQLEYDAAYNPHAVYHMEIKWLVATGTHLESWIKNCTKKAETRFGLQLVKIPTNQPTRSADSFHAPVPLPVRQPRMMRLMEEYLLRECGFVFDSELQGGCRQYMHETGMCAVRRLPACLVWVNNFLPSACHHRKASVHLFTKIKRHYHALLAMQDVVEALVADVSALQLMKSSLF